MFFKDKPVYYLICVALFFIVALVLESTFFNYVKIMGAGPDLILIGIVIAGLFGGTRSATRLGLVLGFLEDLYLGRYLGLNALSKMLTGYLVGLGEGKFFKENLLVPLIAMFSATIIHELLFFIFAGIAGVSSELGEGFWKLILPTAAYNSALGFLTYCGYSLREK